MVQIERLLTCITHTGQYNTINGYKRNTQKLKIKDGNKNK